MIEFFTHIFFAQSIVNNLIAYISVRTLFAGLSSLLLTLILGPYLINWLKKLQIGQFIHQDVTKHQLKAGTPTMGGVLIVFSASLSTLLWMKIDSYYVWLSLISFILFAAIGFLDDWLKLSTKSADGLSAKTKFALQSICAFFIIAFIYFFIGDQQSLSYTIPFFKDVYLSLGVFFIFISFLMIVGFSNAVNLTDGLDGLAIMPVMLISSALALFAYLSGHIELANYLYIPYFAGVGELSIICAAIIGSALGFLWFNSYPAEVFMGDVGSLSLGAFLAIVAILIRQELILIIMGLVFISEALSVMIQVLYYKRTKKRVFLMAPIHHHFELKGFSEPKIIVRFWIITAILVLIGIASLKIR